MKTTIEISKQSESHDAVLQLHMPVTVHGVYESIREAWSTAKQTLEANGITCPLLSEVDVETERDGCSWVFWESDVVSPQEEYETCQGCGEVATTVDDEHNHPICKPCLQILRTPFNPNVVSPQELGTPQDEEIRALRKEVARLKAACDKWSEEDILYPRNGPAFRDGDALETNEAQSLLREAGDTRQRDLEEEIYNLEEFLYGDYGELVVLVGAKRVAEVEIKLSSLRSQLRDLRCDLK